MFKMIDETCKGQMLLRLVLRFQRVALGGEPVKERKKDKKACYYVIQLTTEHVKIS